MNVAIGNIVTIMLDCTLQGCQGTIVKIVRYGDEDGPIGVRFGREHRWLFDPYWKKDNVTRFEESDLRIDSDWSLQTKTLRAYGRSMWHSLCHLPFAWTFANQCLIKDCPHTAVMRGVANVWGSVYEVDLCAQHREEYNGMCGEELSLKPLEAITPA